MLTDFHEMKHQIINEFKRKSINVKQQYKSTFRKGKPMNIAKEELRSQNSSCSSNGNVCSNSALPLSPDALGESQDSEDTISNKEPIKQKHVVIINKSPNLKHKI